MLALSLAGTVLALVFVPAHTDAGYALSANQRTLVAFDVESSHTRSFETPSEAAYAAALTYGRKLLMGYEIGAKIYVDMNQGAPVYSFGACIAGSVDPVTSDEEVTYNTTQTDGHLAVVGLWHEHPSDTPVDSLQSHYAEIASTKQTVWTSIGSRLYVQYWDGGQNFGELTLT
ncbi:MAG TPA: hypothetical protein VFE17_04705 [Candidatus Baltobacteraceae bacterium]|jgi:hypothetical protein|nr:hypothetical protein [Candidatus Baltobacteraceae bacterium]